MASKFTITAELNLQTKNLNQVVNNLRQQFQGANLNIKIRDLAQAQAQLNKISSSAQSAQKSVGLLGSSFSQAFRRFTVVTAVTGTIVGFTRALKNAVGDAIEFEREVVKIAQATGKTTSQLKGLTTEISNVSSSFGVSSKELILAARSLTQAGFAADKVTGALKVLAQTELAATFDSIQDTTEGAIALLNQFGRQAQRTGSEVAFLEKSFSAINQVSKEFAVESSDLVTAIRTTGSAFESAGGSLDELLALFTSVRATTRESAESIATGFRTIFTRVQRVDTINNLKALGIQLQDAEGKFIGPIEATKRLSAALNSIDPRDFRFNLVVEELGGFRQVSKVIPLIQQFAVTQKALNVAQGSSGSLAKDAQTAQQSLAVQIAKTREEFSRFIRDLTGTESFQNTVRFLLDLANAFIKVADSIKPLVPLIAGFATFKAGTAVKGAFDQLAGPRKKNQGGVIGFATGGLVPGSGNGDTVPAMLSPGEFVIRKSSVKKLGADNLARMNGGGYARYGDGTGPTGADKRDISTVQKNIKAVEYTTKEKVEKKSIAAEDLPTVGGKKVVPFDIGAAFLRPSGINADTTRFVPISQDQEIDPIKTSNPILGEKFYNAFKDSKKEGERGVYYKLHTRSLSDPASSQIEDVILNKVVQAVDQAANIASNMTGVRASDDKLGKILKKANIDQISGNIFEAVLLNLNAPFDEADTSGVSFDFKNGLGKVSSLFPDGESLASNPTDARNSFTTDSVRKIGPKIAGLVKEEVDKVNLKKLTDEKIPQLTGQDKGNGLNLASFVPLTGKKTAKLDEIQTALGKAGYSLKSQPYNKYSIVKGAAEEQEFAKGGPSGTDTVPAMLTPGEFVINRKSAQAIGYGALNRMNKVGKYAKGGVVQHFNDGTTGLSGAQAQYTYTASTSNPNPAASVSIDVLSSSLEASAKKIAESGQKTEKAFSISADKMLLFGTVAGSVTSQLGLFDKATADIVSSFGATFATIKGIGGNLIDLGSNIKGLNPKVLTGLSAGLTGFATAQAFAAARITSLGQTAEESGKKFNSFVEALSKGEGTTQGQLTDALTKQFQAASDAQARGSGAAKAAGGVASLVAGGAAVALGAGAFAPIIAAVAGPLTEEILYSVGAFSDSTEKATVQAEALSKAMFSATTSNREFQKFFQNIEKQTPQDVAKQAISLANAYKEQQAQIAKLGDLSKASDAVKQQFQAVSEAAKQTSINLQQIIGVQFQNAVKRSAELLNRGLVPDTNKLLQPVFDTIRSEAETKYRDKIKAAGGERTERGRILKNTREAEISKAQMEYKKGLEQSAKQQLEMIAIANIENNVRKELIGTLQKQSAISASIERLSYELDLASKSVANIDAVFSDSITGLRSKFDTDILKLKSPDQDKLSKALNPIRAIGPIGKDLADNILNINQVMPNLEAKLIQFSTATDTASGALFDVKKFVEESFNIKADSIVGRTLVKIIEGTTTGTGGEKAVTAAKTSLRQEDVRKRIVESFQKFGEEFRTQAGGILDNLARAEQEGRAVAEKINESRQKQLELQLQSVDTFSNYIDALARARGRDLTLLEKNTIRNMKQYALAGNMANNVGAIASELSSNYKALKEGNLNLQQETDIKFASNKLKAALEDLANQSGKTSDILAEIEKQRAKRESARDFGKEFTFGSNEQRQSIANSIQGLQRVLATGNINDIPEELRSGVSSLLDRFKDVPLFNGLTGRQVENKLIANQFRAMGGGQFANMIEADTSTPEQILIGELQRTFAVQIQAQQALSQIEQQKQDALNTALNEYTTAISGYTAQLEALVQKFQKQAEEKAIPVLTPSDIASPKTNLPSVSGGSMGVLNKMVENPNLPSDAKAKIDVENIKETNDAINAFDQAISSADQKIYELTGRLESLVKAIENNSQQNKEKEVTRKQEINKAILRGGEFSKAQIEAFNKGENIEENYAIGGLVYRAGGGSIFQPKGTDTVPAMLTPGEFVIKKSSVDKIGVDNLTALNNGYANGGLVSYLAAGGGASGTNALNDLVKRVAKLEEQVKKLEQENKVLKSALGQAASMNQIAGGMQNMQQVMGNMATAAPAGPMIGMGGMGMGGGMRRVARARRPAFVGPPEPKAQPISTQVVNTPELNLGMQGYQIVSPIELKTKAQTKEDERAALGKRLIDEAKAADEARNKQRADALLNPVGPPAPKGMRPANSIYTEAQWTQMQEKAAKEKELSDLRAEQLKKDMFPGYTPEERDRILSKYKEKPAHLSEEEWLKQISQHRAGQESAFWSNVSKKFAKSELSDYGSGPQSTYTEKTQEALDKAKAINQQADELTARRSGKAVGTNYKSLEDVPVLTADQVGAPVTMKNIADMQAQAKGPAVNRPDLTAAEQSANRVAANQPNQYEGGNALSDFLNAQGQIFGNQAIANRVRQNQEISGIGTVGSRDTILKETNANMTGLDYNPKNLFAKNKPMFPGFFARGGSTDTVPAMLTPGEFVMNKDVVSKYGKSFMEKMNRGGVVPGFANGGYVGYYAGGGSATVRNRRDRGMYDGQMMTTAQAMQRSVMLRQNMMANQFANNPMVQQGVMANPMATNQQKPATGGGNAVGAVGGGMADAAQQFSQFVTQFSDAAKMMTGMTMTHKVTVDGQLNIGGIDGNAVANQIRDAIGNYVGKLVEEKMSKKMGEAN